MYFTVKKQLLTYHRVRIDSLIFNTVFLQNDTAFYVTN